MGETQMYAGASADFVFAFLSGLLATQADALGTLGMFSMWRPEASTTSLAFAAGATTYSVRPMSMDTANTLKQSYTTINGATTATTYATEN